jgi:hypothetical protein
MRRIQGWCRHPPGPVTTGPYQGRFGPVAAGHGDARAANDRTTERPNDRTTERPNDRTTERPNDRTTERPND